MSDSKRYVRVQVRARELKRLLDFLGARSLDLGCGRPRQEGDDWLMVFYCPEEDSRDLAAEGCSFEIDHDFFDRLQRARLEEEKSRPSREEMIAALERGDLPTTQGDRFPMTPRKRR